MKTAANANLGVVFFMSLESRGGAAMLLLGRRGRSANLVVIAVLACASLVITLAGALFAVAFLWGTEVGVCAVTLDTLVRQITLSAACYSRFEDSPAGVFHFA
jgi:hypothetical protein